METDRTETRNVAAEHPDIVKDLSARYEAWAEKCQVRPWELTKG